MDLTSAESKATYKQIQNYVLEKFGFRDVVITNLIDSYDRLIEFGQKHLNDLFV